MGAQAVRLTSIDIDNALNNNHFEVIFQPIFNLSDGALMRMEAFVRWVHPGLGVLPPGAFISFFENQGRMNELTRYVIRRALTQYKSWRGNQGPGFSVNLAFSDLADDTFPEWLSTLLAEEAFPAEFMTLECPNTPANVSLAEAAACFSALKKIGTRLAVEVRGRTNDVLRDIDPFPFDEVKTGGSAILRFARTVRGGPGLTAISELLELAHKNNACTVAVGVEDHASLQALASLGFMAAQGNYLAGVGAASEFPSNTINNVRAALSLDPLPNDQLNKLLGGQVPAVTNVEPERAEPTNVSSTNKLPDEDSSEQERKRTTKAAQQKKRNARTAAKQRAMKKAASLRAAAEKAQIELEEKQKRLNEAAAKRSAEHNARRLQERLSQTFEDQADTSEASDNAQNSPATEDPAPEAGLLLGGSLANSALGRPDGDHPGQSPDKTAKETLAPTDTPVPALDEATTDVSQDPPPLDESETDKHTASSLNSKPHTSNLNLTGIEANEETASHIPEVAVGERIPREEFSLEIAGVRARQIEQAEISLPDGIYSRNLLFQPVSEMLAPVEEIELKSEDEILDEAFVDAEILDPTGHHEEHIDEQIELDSTERHIAEKLLRAPITTRRKNLLQRRYRITHFWPKSWKRKWAAQTSGNSSLAPEDKNAAAPQ